jgi:hypothetical protein
MVPFANPPLPHRQRGRHAAIAAVAVIAALILGVGASAAHAFPFYPDRLPNGALNTCANCHLDPAGGGARNPFGLAFVANGRTWEGLEELDSDGDGVKNADELQDLTRNWLEGQDPPGSPYLVSSPGRADSRPGERLLVLSEVNHPADPPGAPWKIELTNLHSESVLLSGKWLGASTLFDTENPVAGQVRLDDAITSEALGPGEVVVIDFPIDQLSGWDGEDGWLALTLFEQSGAAPPPSIDPTLEHTYGDYVEWGSTPKPFNANARQASVIPQWDSAVGVSGGVAPGGSIEYDFVGEGVNDWYQTPIPFTLGLARPVLVEAFSSNIELPRGAFPFDSTPVGTESTAFGTTFYAFLPPVALPDGYNRHAVVQSAPAFDTGRGEQPTRVLRFDADPPRFPPPIPLVDREEWRIGSGGVVNRFDASVSFDLAISPAPPPGTEVEVSLRVARIATERFKIRLTFTGGVATASSVVFTNEKNSTDIVGERLPLPETMRLSAVGEWVHCRLDMDSSTREGRIFVGRPGEGFAPGSPVVDDISLIYFLPPFMLVEPPLPGTVSFELIQPLPAPGEQSYSVYVRNLEIRSDLEDVSSTAAMAR